MSAGAYLEGVGLACSLGRGVGTIVPALQQAPVAPALVRVAEGALWPVHVLPPPEGAVAGEGGWYARLLAQVQAVVAQCGTAVRPDGPLFVASSSLDAGHEEEGPDGPAGGFAGDLHGFAEAVARSLDWRGPVFTVSTACTSSVNAALAALDMIEAGAAAHALVLGIEFSNRFTVGGFGAMQLLSPDRARPLGAGRNGLVLGEAIAAVCLQAQPSRWRLCGGANVVDGRDPTGVQRDSVVAAAAAALRRSGLRPRDIDLIKPHAAGSALHDAVEVQALHALFARLPPLVTFKGHIGHTLGAAGVTELALLMACIEHGRWPASADALDPALEATRAAHGAWRPRHMLLQSVGFGGGHAALVLEDRGA